jgi:hypothetical protein
LLVYGIIRGGDAGSWLERGVVGPIAAGLAVLTVFCVHESRTEHPSLDVRLFRDPRLSSAAAAIGLNFFAMSGVYFFMSFYLQDVRGYTPMHAGLLTTPVAIGQLIASNRSASLVGRFGAKAVAASGLAIVTFALIGYHSLTAATPIIGLEAIFFLQGAGMGIVMPTATESSPWRVGGTRASAAARVRRSPTHLGRWPSRWASRSSDRSWPGPTADLAPGLRALPAGSRAAATQSIRRHDSAPASFGPGGAALVSWPGASFMRDARHHRVLGGHRSKRCCAHRDVDAGKARADPGRPKPTTTAAAARRSPF